MPTVLQGQVLCFPHIEFPDTTWLKAALCLWDRVHRIVPPGYRPKDDDEVKKAIDEGLVVDLNLTERDLSTTRTNFLEILGRLPSLPHALDPKGALITKVHTGKIDEQLIREFEGLVGRLHREEDWLYIPKGLANGYLLYLAQTVSKRRVMPRITDSDAMFVAMQYFAAQRQFGDFVHEVHGRDASAAVALRTIMPGGLEWAPMERVLKFHSATTDGRAALRCAFQELVEELANVEEPNYVEEMARAFVTRLKQAEEITAARIKELFTDPTSLALQVGIPVASSGVASLLQDDTSVILIGKILIQLVGAFAGAITGTRKQWRSPEATYLARLNQTFDGDVLFPERRINLHKLMDEFLND